MSKILPRKKYYEDQILRWTIYYDEQNITMTKILRWTKQYDEHNNTMNKIYLWWTKYYDEQNITTNNILRWPKYYDEQIYLTSFTACMTEFVVTIIAGAASVALCCCLSLSVRIYRSGIFVSFANNNAIR